MENYEDYDFPSLGDATKDTIDVEGPSGAVYKVIHEDEEVYWNNVVDMYLRDYKFTNVSDLQDLDRVVSMELLLYRYEQWIHLEQDYFGIPINVVELNKIHKDKDAELRAIKSALGINKVSREKDQGDSVAAYIENLRRRAQEFGFNRNEQAVKAITLFQELIGMMTYHEKSTPEERKRFHIEDQDIMQWIRNTIPEFEEIDKQFREGTQRYWISEM